jgi:hypothetical protein
MVLLNSVRKATIPAKVNDKSEMTTLLGANEDVGHVLVLAQQWQVQEDLERLGISSEHDELGKTAVQGLGG